MDEIIHCPGFLEDNIEGKQEHNEQPWLLPKPYTLTLGGGSWNISRPYGRLTYFTVEGYDFVPFTNSDIFQPTQS